MAIPSGRRVGISSGRRVGISSGRGDLSRPDTVMPPDRYIPRSSFSPQRPVSADETTVGWQCHQVVGWEYHQGGGIYHAPTPSCPPIVIFPYRHFPHSGQCLPMKQQSDGNAIRSSGGNIIRAGGFITPRHRYIPRSSFSPLSRHCLSGGHDSLDDATF